jgi:4-amino-4-deoxy-L-arabinose transferase-like glycosyltransferase
MTLQRSILALVLLWGAIYLASTGYPPALLDDADTVHAEAAREMAESNNFVTLYANKIRYLEKAPMMYWSVALAYKIFGVNEFASRLPIALAALALILTTLLIGRHIFDERAGFYAGLIVATCIGVYLFTRVMWPDVMLTLFLALAFYCFLRASEYEFAKPSWAYGIYFFGALAVLTKGLIGAAFPALIIITYLLITGQIRHLLKLKLFTGALLFFVVAAPWHLLAGFQNRSFFWFYFINEHFLRYIGKRYPADYDTVPKYLFFTLHLVWLFPWSLFLPLAIQRFPYRIRHLNSEEKARLFLWVWLVMIILFFSFSTSQEYYTMPAYPAFALLIAHAINEAEKAWPMRRGKKLIVTMQVALAVFCVAVFAAGVFAYWKTRQFTIQGDISTTLTRNPEAYALSLGHILDLTPESLAALHLPVLGTAIAFLLGGVLALIFRVRNHHLASNLCLALMMAGFFFCAHRAFIQFEPYLSSKSLAEAIKREYQDGEIIVLNGEYEGGSSINFYTRQMVHILNGRQANLEHGSYYEDAPQIFLTDEDLAKMWSEPRRVYLFTDALLFVKVTGNLQTPVYKFAEGGGKLILTNQQSP